MHRGITMFLLAGLLVSGCQNGKSNQATSSLEINNQKFSLELAQTSQEKYQGLSNREHLCSSCGMLFVYEQAQNRTFVMRGMNFPLDIVWIKDQKIVKIDRNLAPEAKEPWTKYSSGQPVDLVLELNGNSCQKYNIQVGDKIDLNIPQ